MAFGFPAYHQEVVSNVPGNINLELSFLNTLRSLGWGPSFDENGITASTGAASKSIGEKIIISVENGATAKVRSESALKSICTDFGKNQKNVELILRELPSHYVVG
jgi:hypothetical protein